MTCRIPAWLIPLLAVALWLPTGQVQAQIFSGSTQSRMMGRANQGANYFAIMGHVKYPQTYQLPTSAPSLVDFIRFAGGALESATGEARIIRGGRDAQRVMLSSNSTIKLMPGDLVILDGGRTGRGSIFRGGSNRQGNAEGDSSRLNQVCLFGVLPYPIIMQMTSDVATKRWIISQLGQDAAIANAVKVTERRNFSGPSGVDTRLSDNSILIFPPGVIDTPKLPELPRPFRAGKDRHPDQKPLTGLPPNTNEGSAAAQLPLPITRLLPGERSDTAPDNSRPGDVTPPGYSEVPDGEESADSVGSNPDAARNLLTHPGSVALDEKPPTLPGRARLSDSGTATTGRPRTTGPPRQNPTPEATDSEIRFNANVVKDAEAAQSPAAEKPFQSQPDPALTSVRPERDSRISETSELPLTPLAPGDTEIETPAITSPAPAVQLLDPPQEQTQIPDPIQTPVVSRQPASAEPAVPAGPSMALNGAAGFANPIRVSEPPFPGGSTSKPPAEAESKTSPRMPDPSTPGTPKFSEASMQSLPRTSDEPSGDDVSVVGKSRIIRREKSASRWPLITAGVIGSLGFLAAFSLLLSMTGPAPPTLAHTTAEKNDRYWLDKIINDELPVTEESAAEPVVSELFGRPTDAPTLRLDAGHSEIPRPHFLDRGRQSGVGQRRSPQPDIPQPDSKRPDDENGTDGNGPRTMPPRRTGPPSRSPDTPLAPAAEQKPASAVAERPAAVPKPKRRIVRVDSGHGPGVPSRQPAEAAPTIAVKPAESVAAGSDLLDRILASVESEKARTSKKHPSQKDPS
jgi:hypothetical protein